MNAVNRWGEMIELWCSFCLLLESEQVHWTSVSNRLTTPAKEREARLRVSSLAVRCIVSARCSRCWLCVRRRRRGRHRGADGHAGDRRQAGARAEAEHRVPRVIVWALLAAVLLLQPTHLLRRTRPRARRRRARPSSRREGRVGARPGARHVHSPLALRFSCCSCW